MRSSWLLAATLLALGVIAARAWTAPPTNQVRDFMRLKLDHAQKALEGIVLEDYDLISKHSQQLSLVSQASNWQVLQTEEYLQHSGEFRRATEAMTKAAKEKNLDGAALAYLETTMKCVNCHQYVRDTRQARLDLDFPRR
jgi:hypothetical protein